MSGYAIHILAYWIISFILVLGLKEVNVLSPAFDTILLSVFIGTVYAILPDIDTPNSLIRRLVEKTALIFVVLLLGAYLFTNQVLLVYGAIILALVLFFLWTMKHRGIFHTYLAGIVLSLPLLFFSYWFCGFAFLGYATHLVVDKL